MDIIGPHAIVLFILITYFWKIVSVIFGTEQVALESGTFININVYNSDMQHTGDHAYRLRFQRIQLLTLTLYHEIHFHVNYGVASFITFWNGLFFSVFCHICILLRS